jgi:hypothetical protein
MRKLPIVGIAISRFIKGDGTLLKEFWKQRIKAPLLSFSVLNVGMKSEISKRGNT